MILSRNMVVKKVNVMNKEEAYSGEWPVKPYYTSNPQLSSSASFLRLNVLSSLN